MTQPYRASTVAAMPVPIRLIAALTERVAHIVIKVEGGGRESRIAEFDRDTAGAWIPAELQEKLIKLADRFIYKD